ncbi:RNA ligase family protein [Niabella ginsengisoli]|uniref:RNA ligase domain-containing protein n=1 Tax=Niabella ginsengisoli TaxID=522298 RepID=A0ABS9SJY4_9BACT|nr:RNA ligase family protein [Niabella ginsengisoli]MCH5598668.1 hypothetical protein [Niabella ginsengisoli]
MEFKKYNSIENSYQNDFISSIVEQGFDDLEFVVQEKVHGANLSFITDGQNILSAKRTELILDSEEFYNSKYVLANYKDKILNLYKAISADIDTKTVTIFGEIFGGGYPHPDIPKDDTAKLVQRGIYYCPQNDFYAFDILLDNDKYLDVETANAYFEKFGFVYAKTLHKGNLKDCLAYSNTFKTTIPTEYKLPELDGNICEGVVVRPTQATFFRNGSRVIIKNKNEKWSENNNYIDKTILSKLLHEGEELSEEASFYAKKFTNLLRKTDLTT